MDSGIDQAEAPSRAGPRREGGLRKPAIAAMMLRIFGEAS
jgi:hypothetical protein